MTTILIINAASSGLAVVSLLALKLRALRRDRRVRRVYVTVDGRHVTRDEPS